MSVMLLSWIFVLHFVGDFVLQSRWMGMNKSHDFEAMAAHISVYTIVLAFGMVWFGGGLIFALISGLLHFCTDAVSSRMSSKYYAEQKMHAFWTTIGADQMVHGLCLIWAAYAFL